MTLAGIRRNVLVVALCAPLLAAAAPDPGNDAGMDPSVGDADPAVPSGPDAHPPRSEAATSAPATDRGRERQALARPASPSALERGLAAFRAGDWAGAAPALAEAHAADPADLDVALLLGITRFRLGRLGDAEPPLRAAEASADEETRASARIFLALLAAERGQADAVRTLLFAAAASSAPTLARTGRELLVRTTPRLLSMSLLVRAGFDSNVPMLPGLTTPADLGAADRADGDVTVLAAISVRPFRRIGLTLEDLASYRQQFRLTDWSLFLNSLGLRYRYDGTRDRVALGYDFEAMALGQAFLGLGHVAQGAYRRAFGDEFGIGLRYTFRYHDYRADEFLPFSGGSHLAAIEAGFGTAESPRELSLAGLFVRDGASDPVYAAIGGGARLYGRLRLRRRAELSLAASFLRRVFDQPNPLPRDDWQLAGELTASVNLGQHFALLAGLSALRNLSTVSDFDYFKLTVWLGAAAGWAGL